MSQALYRTLRSLFFAPVCLVCHQTCALPLCPPCRADFVPPVGPLCEVCGDHMETPGVCNNCRRTPPAFAQVRAAFIHEGALRNAIHALKFSGRSALAAPLGRALAERYEGPVPDRIVPVPLHPRRERARGYNQAALLARPLAQTLRRPLEHLLRRRYDTPAQSGQTRHDRYRILDAFEPRGRVSGTVLLVDDVVTTGATLDACAHALRTAGAETVLAVALARAVLNQ
ncbi:MAG: phosphoribosyltransferase family protein [Candidatus Xenobia bacterium]